MYRHYLSMLAAVGQAHAQIGPRTAEVESRETLGVQQIRAAMQPGVVLLPGCDRVREIGP